jgi:phytoene dehydrogenase-like protein
MVIGKGGADTVVNAMVALFQQRGGELILGEAAQEVEIDGSGAAQGVQLSEGRSLTARKAVIANLHPKNIFGKLVADRYLSVAFRRKVDRFRSGPGTMMIHIAADAPLDWIAGEELRKYAYVHLAPDYGMMSRVYAEAMDGLLPAEPALVIGQPTAIDPTRAPEGRHVLWIQVRMVPDKIRADAAGQIKSREWDSAKYQYVERVLDIVEKYAPNIRQSIIGMNAFSPVDLTRLNANLIGGDSLGGSHHLDQNFMLRPFIGYSRYKTPVKSLYMCGASTWPGAGTGAGSGFILGQMLAGK